MVGQGLRAELHPSEMGQAAGLQRHLLRAVLAAPGRAMQRKVDQVLAGIST
jgi:hypothetical protein